MKKKSISNESIERIKLIHNRLNRYDQKKYDRKKKKMRENLNINENVLVWQRELEKHQLWESFTNNLFKIYLTLTKRKYFSLEKRKKKLIKSATTG